MNTNPKIGAIVVLYKPDKELLQKGLSSLSKQVETVCVVDNTPEADISAWISQFQGIHYIPIKANIGIAAAQNRAIDYLIENSFDYVLFSDQDSVCENNVVSILYECYTELEKNGIKVGAIGPLPYNYSRNSPYITKQNIIREVIWKNPIHHYKILEMYSIISSFSLIKLDSFKQVGKFYENLFIDGVDNEWGWRARYFHNMGSYLITDIKISHTLGCDGALMYRKSTPFRTYYQFRNFLWLRRLEYTPKYWKRLNFLKIIVKTFFYPIFVTPRLKYMKNIFKGYQDGLRYKLITK